MMAGSRHSLRIVGQAHRLPGQPERLPYSFTTSVGFQNWRAESRCCAGRDYSREQSTQTTQSPLCLVLCSLPPCQRESATPPKFIAAHGTRLPRHPKIKEITNSTRNITNRSFAMPADAAAIPPNPKIAATSAMIRNITAQPNISLPPPRLNRICRLIRAPQLRCSVENSEQPNDLPQPETSPLSGAALSAARSFY
jgi:hypothetical protein